MSQVVTLCWSISHDIDTLMFLKNVFLDNDKKKIDRK